MADVNDVQDQDAAEAGQQIEAFPLGSLAGEGVTLKTLQKPNHSLDTTCALSRAQVPLIGGLLDPGRRARVLVTVRPGKLTTRPVRDDEAAPDKVTGWTLAQDLVTQHVRNVPTDDRELVLHLVRAMLDDAPQAAGGLVDELSAMVAAELAPA